MASNGDKEETENQPKRVRRVIRLSDKAYSRLKTISEIKHLPLSVANEIAINMLGDVVEYSYENILKKLNQQPKLKLYQEQFTRMLKEADSETIEAVIKILELGQVSFYECSFSEIDKTITEIKKTDCKKMVVITRVNVKRYPSPTPEIRKQIDESFKKFKELPCEKDEQMLIDPSFDNEDTTSIRIAMFVLKKEMEHETKK